MTNPTLLVGVTPTKGAASAPDQGISACRRGGRHRTHHRLPATAARHQIRAAEELVRTAGSSRDIKWVRYPKTNAGRDSILGDLRPEMSG